MATTVVVLNDYCYVNGGGSKIAIDEAVGLADAGFDVLFVGAVGPICKELREARLRVVCLDQHELRDATERPWIALQSIWNNAAFKCADAILSGLRPSDTVVHLHGYTKALSTSPVRAATRRRFPVICTLHDFFSACPNGAFFNYPQRSLCRKRGLSIGCIATRCDKRHHAHKMFRVGRSLIQTRFGKLPGDILEYITLSDASAAILRPYLPANARLHALENPVDVEKQAPVDVAANAALVAIGRLDIEKGLELLARVARQRRFPAMFVGDGPLRSFLEAEQGAAVTGWMDHTDVLSTLDGARCLVFPSLWYETYGLVVSEAAARGVPAIVSDISAAAERVVNGVTGWHFKSGDSDDLARCLAIVADDVTVASAGRAAYERYWSNPPTRQQHIRDLAGIYEKILDGRDRPAVRDAAHPVTVMTHPHAPEQR